MENELIVSHKEYGELHLVNLQWTKTTFNFMKQRYANAFVAVEDAQGNRFIVRLRTVEWLEQPEKVPPP